MTENKSPFLLDCDTLQILYNKNRPVSTGLSVLCFLKLDILIDYAHFPENKYRNGYCRQDLADGLRVEQTVNAHEFGEDKRCGEEVDKLSCHRRDHCLDGLADGLEEDRHHERKGRHRAGRRER